MSPTPWNALFGARQKKVQHAPTYSSMTSTWIASNIIYSGSTSTNINTSFNWKSPPNTVRLLQALHVELLRMGATPDTLEAFEEELLGEKLSPLEREAMVARLQP